MKKKLLLLILLLIPFIVNAKESLTIDWIKEDNEAELTFLSETDGYYNYVYYDEYDNNVVKYAIDKESNEGSFNILDFSKLNEKEAKIAYGVRDSRILVLNPEKEYYLYTFENKVLEGTTTGVQNNGTYIYDLTDEEAHEYFGEYYFIYTELKNHEDWRIENAENTHGIDYLDNYYGVHYFDKEENMCNSILYTKAGEKVIEKEFECPNIAYELERFQGMHFAATNDNIYLLSQDENFKLYLTKYDLNGQKISEQELKELYKNLPQRKYFVGGINFVDSGIIIDLQVRKKIINSAAGNNTSIKPTYLINQNQKLLPKFMQYQRPYYHTIIFKYSNSYNINTKVAGQGKIKVDTTTAASGEGVTFTVEPEEGYVLSAVKVTDANGNVIEFHDYTFTMPSADVTIEAVFELEHKDETQNPLTIDTILIVLPTLLIIGVIVGLMYKKVSWLK